MIQAVEYREQANGYVLVRVYDAYGIAWEDEIPEEDFFTDGER